jgi:nucleoside 2-deoxyribosyltransferase
MKVYLCGSINGCSDEECKNWRDYAKIKIPYVVDPMRRDYRGIENISIRDIVELDKKDIDGSDIVLVNYNKPSVGTSMEILYAYERNRIVITVAKDASSISPWLKYHSDCMFNNIDDAINYILYLYKNNLETRLLISNRYN